MLRKLTEFAECTGTPKAYRDTYLRTPKSGYTGIPVISRTPKQLCAYLFTFVLPLKWFELHIFYINK